MAIVVLGAVFVDVKGFPLDKYIPTGRNAGTVVTVHGGVGRNVAEDIANVELRPTFVSLVDEGAQGEAIIAQLRRHKVNTDYIIPMPNGMGMWLAVFDQTGELAGSISRRPELMPIAELLDEKGDEIFRNADSIVIEIDMEQEVVKRVFKYAEKYGIRVYALVSNMTIALGRRDFLQKTDCFICNEEEAEIFFVDKYTDMSPEETCEKLYKAVLSANIHAMVVTLGARGAVYADMYGNRGWCPAEKVKVRDTTGAGDAFCAGVSIGLTYGKTLSESVKIGSRLAASVITASDNVCPRFRPKELGIDIDVED